MDIQELRMLLLDKNEDFICIKELSDEKIEDVRLTVDYARSSKEMLSKINRFSYDVILLEYNSIQKNGISLVKRIRSKVLSAPIFLIIGRENKKEILKLLKAGATDYFYKENLSPESFLTAACYAARLFKRELMKQKEEILSNLKNSYPGSIDELTGLYSRVYFEEQVKRFDGQRMLPLSLIIGNVNGLKLVNEAFGHQVGDKVLTIISRILKNICRKEDVIARWGSDEFAVLLPQTDFLSAGEFIKAVKNACDKDNTVPVQISITLGIAAKVNVSEDINEVLKKAEFEVYRLKYTEAKKLRSSIIASLIKIIGEKDYETEEHAWRMQKLAVQFGTELQLSDSQLDELILTVTLHDIGKMAIPDHILMKPGSLTPEEWEIVKEHPERGYRIVFSSRELANIAPAVLHHHERWDGKGYPHGLKGKEIPLLSRIVAIIDAYDVMTNRRPYKKAITHWEAVEELRECAGSQFDPQLVECFIELVSRACVKAYNF